MTRSDDGLELRRITLLERNAEYYDAAGSCFALYKKTGVSEVALRGFQNLIASVWRAKTFTEMDANLTEFLSYIRKNKNTINLQTEQIQLLNAITLEAEGWSADPPNTKKFIQSVKLLITLGQLTKALDLISSLIAYLPPERQTKCIRYGFSLLDQLPPEQKDSYFIILSESLLNNVESSEKTELLNDIYNRVLKLSKISERDHIGNIAVIKGLDLIHPYRIEYEKAKQLRQENVHELVRSLADTSHNRLRGIMLSLLGSSFYRMAEPEQDPELRQELYKRAKDYFIQSVETLERSPAYGELLQAYTLAGTGFLSIAELEQDFEQRNELYQLGQDHLRKARIIGQKTKLYHLQARAAINLGVARERLSWFEYDPKRRKEILTVVYELQLEGKEFAEKTKELRSAGYATMNASEICGFLSDLETRQVEKLQWTRRQRELSQKGLLLLEQTQDCRGKVVALSYAAFACARQASLSPSFDEKKQLYEEMLNYAKQATTLAEEVPDPVVTAYAFQQAGDAAQYLGVLTSDVGLLSEATKFYEAAFEDWAKTGERHKQAEVLTQQADNYFYQSGLESTSNQIQHSKLLERSKKLHQEAANLFTKLFYFHDVGENYWRIGQIRILQSDFIGAQELFDQMQKAFDQVSQLIPNLTEVYSVFSSFGMTFVGLVDGLNIIHRGNYDHAEKLFKELAKGLSHETERSLRQLRQLLDVLSRICNYASTQDENISKQIYTHIERLKTSLSSDAYEQQLPYGFYRTLTQLQKFLQNLSDPFPPVLIDLPLQEKMLAMAQTRHIVTTALNLYQSTAEQRETTITEPTEDVIRSYIERISSIITNR